MRHKTLFQIAALFFAFSIASYGSAILVTDSTGFAVTVTLSTLGGPFEVSPFTDSNGNKASLVGLDGQNFVFGTSPVTFAVVFAQPVTQAVLPFLPLWELR
jgi:hypothetical protein